MTISFPMLGKFPNIIPSNILSVPFSFSSSSGTPIILMLVRFSCPRGLWDCPHFFSFFFLYSVPWQWFPPFYLPAYLAFLLPQLFCYWFLLVYFHFIYCIVYHCLFFSSSRSLLNISCIFWICASILFQRSWIIFTIIALNSFSGRLPVSSSFCWSYRFLPCSFFCSIFLCCLTLSAVFVVSCPQAAGL